MFLSYKCISVVFHFIKRVIINYFHRYIRHFILPKGSKIPLKTNVVKAETKRNLIHVTYFIRTYMTGRKSKYL